MSPEQDYIYVVRRSLPPFKGYEVIKLGDATDTVDSYTVTFNKKDEPWCDCQGFRRQTYDKELHKHVMLVRDFIGRGEPVSANYHIYGKSGKHTIEFLGALHDIKTPK